MFSRSYAMQLAGAALLAIGALHIAASDAMAAKEKFTRNKPHVNVGTVGSTSSQGGTSTVTTPSQPAGDGPEAECDTERKSGSSETPPTC